MANCYATRQNIYAITNAFPESEKFGLVSQMRRCAVSIASNIAEGCGRGTDKQLVHFLDIAQGSAYELETQIILSENIGFISSADILVSIMDEINHTQRLLHNFKKHYQKSI